MTRPPKSGQRGRGSKNRGRRKRPVAKVPQLSVEVVIDKLGAHGDGLARAEVLGHAQTLYIAGALPGERVMVQTAAKRGDGLVANLLEVIESSAERVAPGCPHFAQCGGCALQHLNTAAGLQARTRCPSVAPAWLRCAAGSGTHLDR